MSDEPSGPTIYDIMDVIPNVILDYQVRDWGKCPLSFDELVACLVFSSMPYGAAVAEAHRLLATERLLKRRGRGRPRHTPLEDLARHYRIMMWDGRVSLRWLHWDAMRANDRDEFQRQAAEYQHRPASPKNRAIEDVALECGLSFETIEHGIKELHRNGSARWATPKEYAAIDALIEQDRHAPG